MTIGKTMRQRLGLDQAAVLFTAAAPLRPEADPLVPRHRAPAVAALRPDRGLRTDLGQSGRPPPHRDCRLRPARNGR